MKADQKLILFFVLAIPFSCKNESVDEVETGPPNIILLLTDDQRHDALSYAGNPVLETPNMDELAQQGVYFQNAFVTTSICAMSRASILTGQYARRHDIWDFGESLTNEQYENTYPALLKKAGYTTGFIGKFGVGNISPAMAAKYFDYWRGFNGQGSYKANYNGQSIHLTEKIGHHAVEFLAAQTDTDQPFSLSISFKAPHVEGDPGYFLPDEAYAQLYQSANIDKPVAADDQYFEYFPGDFIKNKNGAVNVARKRWQDRFSSGEKFQANVKKYYQLIHGVDVMVGRIMDQLNTLGLADNTIIIFTSDNGFYLGEYGFAGKWYGSDPSIRVPMIIFDPRPGAPKGKVIENMVLNIDLAPTMLSMAGVAQPASMQGEDLTPLMTGNALSWRTEFLYEHLWPSSNAYYIPSSEGVVTEKHKYMKYFLNRDFDDVMFEELYDRTLDENEVSNKIEDTNYKETLNALKQKLATMREDAR